MYILVQGDTTESKVEGQSMSGGQVQGHLQPRQTVSLLKTSSLQADILQQNDPSVAWKRHRGSGEASPQVVVVSKGDKSVSVMGSSLLTKSILKPYRGEPEKKIIKTGPKKPKPKEEDLKQKIRALRPDGHCSLQSLIQAAVMSHPIIAADVATHLHPYCARSKEDWLSWNVGKRRASEWHRASSVRKFIIQHLGGITMFKGEKLWSTKQILVWCRHHAYSPHYLEKTLHPTAVDLQSEHSLPSNRQRKYKSVSCADVLLSDVLMSPDRHRANTECESDEEVEIVSLELPKAKVKVEPEETEEVYIQEYLPVSDEAKFVQNTTHQMGMKYGPVEVDDGYYGNMSEDIVYRAMQSFMSDILRETFSLKVNVGRYPDGLGISDVYSSLQSMSTADFITNKYLGVPEDKTVPTAYR